MDLDPGSGEHACGIVGQLRGEPARVAPDDDALLPDRRVTRDQRIGHAARHLTHQLAIHPSGTGADHAAQPGRPEFQALRKPLSQRVEVVGVE